mmetsp:Transcript_45979/g.133870  ORF Transcript_45979/g.133870 Transcript_45979/m.133870 type:complete len:232 (+) Transcript_45979:1267-1962(+)
MEGQARRARASRRLRDAGNETPFAHGRPPGARDLSTSRRHPRGQGRLRQDSDHHRAHRCDKGLGDAADSRDRPRLFHPSEGHARDRTLEPFRTVDQRDCKIPVGRSAASQKPCEGMVPGRLPCQTFRHEQRRALDEGVRLRARPGRHHNLLVPLALFQRLFRPSHGTLGRRVLVRRAHEYHTRAPRRQGQSTQRAQRGGHGKEVGAAAISVAGNVPFQEACLRRAPRARSI